MGYPMEPVKRWFSEVEPTIRSKMIEDSVNPTEGAFRMRLGSSGSIWFMAHELAGAGVTKRARINLMGHLRSGGISVKDVDSFRIIVDPTFDIRWR